MCEFHQHSLLTTSLDDDILQKSKPTDGCLNYFIRKTLYVKKQFQNFMFLSTTGGRLFVNGLEDEATTCTFSRGCCEVIRTAEKAVCGGLSHLRKYDLLNIFKTNIPLRLLIYTIITLIAGVCHQIVKYTGKHR